MRGAAAAAGAILVAAACGGSRRRSPPPPPPALALPDAGPAPVPEPVAFTDTTGEAGLPGFASPCVVFDDLDGDDRPDLLINESPVGMPLAWRAAVWRNRGDGTFEEHSLDGPGEWGMMGQCNAGDVDGDGDLDLILGQFEPPRVVLLENRGSLQFEDVTERWGLADVDPGDSELTFDGFLDLDNDGWLDLYLTYAESFCTTESCGADDPDAVQLDCGTAAAEHSDGTDLRCEVQPPFPLDSPALLRSDGARFEPVATAPPGRSRLGANAVGLWDWDDDGFTDVLHAAGYGANSLYRNPGPGGGPWRDLLSDLGAGPWNDAGGVAVGDLDRDGCYDFWVPDAGPDQVWYGACGDGPVPEHIADRAFEVTDPITGLSVGDFTARRKGWSPVIADFNHDGWPDVLVSSTASCLDVDELAELMEVGIGLGAACSGPQGDTWFTGDGRGGFVMREQEHPARTLPAAGSAGYALADYDGDGDLDAAYAFTPGGMRFRLLRNDSERLGRHLIVRLRGRGPAAGGANRFGEGARVELVSGGRVIQRGQLHGATGSIIHGWRALHFGLGDVASLDEVRVRWPTDPPHVQVVPGPITDDEILIEEE